MSYELIITEDALSDILRMKKSGEKAALKKLSIILDELRENPRTGTGQPEQLKYQFSGKWSRRITPKHRLIYEIQDELVQVEIIQIFGHY
jgi:toxin YoeB